MVQKPLIIIVYKRIHFWIILLVNNRSHSSSSHNLDREELCLSPVIILAAFTCKFSKILESVIEQLSQTISPYLRTGLIHILYFITSDLRFILYFNMLRRLRILAALSWIVCICLFQCPSDWKWIPWWVWDRDCESFVPWIPNCNSILLRGRVQLR